MTSADRKKKAKEHESAVIVKHEETSNLYKELVSYNKKKNDVLVDMKHLIISFTKI